MHSQRKTTDPLFEYVLRLADDRLVLGHRLSEWCGHGPILEEDIALANIALDLVGQANYLLELAGTIEGKKRSADDLAFFRDAVHFRNALLVEQPNGDFAVTMARQFLFDVYANEVLARVAKSKHEDLSAAAQKALTESRYHLRHSRQWILRLGDGTDESRRRIQQAFDDLWIFTGELFEVDDLERALIDDGIAADASDVEAPWREIVTKTLEEATLRLPAVDYTVAGGRHGRHTEHLGHMLAEMQVLPRSHPGAKW